LGEIVEYDKHTGKHTIHFQDGDKTSKNMAVDTAFVVKAREIPYAAAPAPAPAPNPERQNRVQEGEFSQKKVTLRWKVTVDQRGQSTYAKKVEWEVENNRDGPVQITAFKVQANAEQGMPPVPDAVLSGSKYPNNKPAADGPACIIAPGEVGQVLFPVKSSVEVAHAAFQNPPTPPTNSPPTMRLSAVLGQVRHVPHLGHVRRAVGAPRRAVRGHPAGGRRRPAHHLP
jgi:hypothetical protein